MIIGIDSERGQVHIGDPPERLPGIITRLTVKGAIIIDSAEAVGASGANKQMAGWEDADISLSLSVLADPAKGQSAEDRAAVIITAFKRAENGQPVIYRIAQPLLRAWKIRSVVMASLSTQYTTKRNEIGVEIQFIEHEPLVATTQRRQASRDEPPPAESLPPGYGITEAETRAFGRYVE